MPTTRAAVLDEIGGSLTVQELDLAPPRAGEVLVRIAHCGICHSDLSAIDGSFPTPTPIVLGHEAAGVVEEVGPGVTEVAVGDHVVLVPAPSCGRCYFCTRGQPTLCAVHSGALLASTMADGTSPLSRDGQFVHRGLATAAFSELAVMDVAGVVRIPDDVPLATACVLGCAVQTGVGAVLNTAQVEAGATVAVLGAGGVGLSIVQGAVLAGASRIIVSDPVARRREEALALGATDVVDPTTTDLTTACFDLTGVGVDYAFEAAGRTALIEAAIGIIRNGGTAVCVGAPPVEDSLTIPMIVAFGAMEKRLMGCFLGSVNAHRDIPMLIAHWRNGRLRLDELMTDRRPLAEINEAIAAAVALDGIRTVVDLA